MADTKDQTNKDWDKGKQEETKVKGFKQGDKSDIPEDPSATKEFKNAPEDKRGFAKPEQTATTPEAAASAVVDPGVNPWKLREGNEELKKDLGFSNGKCVGNGPIASRIKFLIEHHKLSGDLKAELQDIEAQLTASAG